MKFIDKYLIFAFLLFCVLGLISVKTTWFDGAIWTTVSIVSFIAIVYFVIKYKLLGKN